MLQGRAQESGADLSAGRRSTCSEQVSSIEKQADDRLAALSIPWVIVQPSLVFGHGGASAALFNRLAALPVGPVPGDWKQNIQPIHVDR